MKKISILMAMLALMMFSAVPAFAQSGSEIEVEEGDVTITDTFTIEDSIVQSCPAIVTFGDENENNQTLTDSQNADIMIDGEDNEFEFEQSIEQSGFSPEVSTECTQSVTQAFSGFWFFF